jgi:long-chain fatty acid transport protein
MAAACISYPLDSLVGAYNPAGMVDVGDRLDLEAGWVRDTGSADISGNQSPFARLVDGHFNGMRTKDVYPFSFGINKNFCFCNDWEVGAGLICYNRNYQKTTYTKPFVLLGTSNLGMEYVNQTISPILSIRWCNMHSIGISANFQIERVKVNGIQRFDHAPNLLLGPGSIAPGHVTNRGYNYSTGWGFTIGYRGQITEDLNVGITYQPETSMRRLDKYKGFLAHRGKLNIPQKFGAGISYRFVQCLVVAFDVENIQWSKIKSLHNPLLHDGILEPLGSEHGPGFGFRDQWYYRVGADWQINQCFYLRAGFRHANTPIRKSQTTVNLLSLDTVEDFITVGGTWNITENNEISAVYAYGFEKKINGINAIPTSFGGGNVKIKEEKFAIGASWGYKF